VRDFFLLFIAIMHLVKIGSTASSLSFLDDGQLEVC